jgi:hypothetical protein
MVNLLLGTVMGLHLTGSWSNYTSLHQQSAARYAKSRSGLALCSRSSQHHASCCTRTA